MIIEKANVTCGFYSSVDTSLSSSINWGSGKSFASVRYALQSTETLKSISLWRAHPRNHTTEATWAHVSTTRAPDRHWQYQPLTITSSYSIQSLCDLLDTWRLWIFPISNPSSCLFTNISSEPSVFRCSTEYDFANLSWYTPSVSWRRSSSCSLGKSLKQSPAELTDNQLVSFNPFFKAIVLCW